MIEVSQLKYLILGCGFLFGAAAFFIQQLLDFFFLLIRLLIFWIKSCK